MGNRTCLTDADYDVLSGLVQREYGIDLNKASNEVIRLKLERYRERRALSSVAECVSDILGDETRVQALGDIIYSQATHFNRDPQHFEFLVDSVVREHGQRLSSRGSELSMWSLGCSTGQEAYTIAIYLMERVFTERGSTAPFRITAADCSPSSLRRTSEGRYAPDDVKRLEPLAHHRYFDADGDGHLVVRDEVRKYIEVKRFNIITSEYVFDRRAEYVFMRNAIDFHAHQAKRTELEKLHRLLTPGGHLFLGDIPGMEPADIAACGYREVMHGCYQSTVS